jgi:fucose 4-O-acetylase-like acetyltransferase
VDTDHRSRIQWVDQARGIGIFLVVLGHTLRGLHNGRLIAEDSLAFHRVDSWIYSFHMPLFFLLSGLFAERRTGQEPRRFLYDQFATIAYPYLVWSVLQTLVQMALGRYTNRQVGSMELVGILVNPIMQFWFLYALLLIVLIYYILRRCGLAPLGGLVAFALFWASQGWVSLGIWLPLNEARRNGIFYAVGAVLGHRGHIDRIERAPTLPLAITALAGYALVTAALFRPEGSRPVLALAVAFCGIAASIALAVLFGRLKGLDLVRVMGVYSLEIYVVHTIASAGIRIALHKALKIQDVSIHVVLGTLAGIVLPLLLARFCERFHVRFVFRLPRRRAGTRTAPIP